MHDRAALDEALARDERDEERVVGNLEQHAQSPHQKRHDEHVGEREGVERVGDRDRADHERTAEIGCDHDLPLARALVGPGARVE